MGLLEDLIGQQEASAENVCYGNMRDAMNLAQCQNQIYSQQIGLGILNRYSEIVSEHQEEVLYSNRYLEKKRKSAIEYLGNKWVMHKDHVQTVNQQLSARQAKSLLISGITEKHYSSHRTVKFSLIDRLRNRFLG